MQASAHARRLDPRVLTHRRFKRPTEQLAEERFRSPCVPYPDLEVRWLPGQSPTPFARHGQASHRGPPEGGTVVIRLLKLDFPRKRVEFVTVAAWASSASTTWRYLRVASRTHLPPYRLYHLLRRPSEERLAGDDAWERRPPALRERLRAIASTLFRVELGTCTLPSTDRVKLA